MIWFILLEYYSGDFLENISGYGEIGTVIRKETARLLSRLLQKIQEKEKDTLDKVRIETEKSGWLKKYIGGRFNNTWERFDVGSKWGKAYKKMILILGCMQSKRWLFSFFLFLYWDRTHSYSRLYSWKIKSTRSNNHILSN